MFILAICLSSTVRDLWLLNEFILLYTIVILCLVLSYFIMKGIYSIYNVNKDMVESTLTSILIDEGVAYEIKGDSVI